MKEIVLIVSIILLLIYAFIVIDSIVLVLKNKNKRISSIRDILLKRINVCIVLTVIIAILLILRIVVFK